LGNKFSLFAITWLFSALVTLILRYWGIQHPEPFLIRPIIVLGLLFGPSIILCFYLAFASFQNHN